MLFEWDERKRQSNLEKHGVDFLKAALIFDGPTLTKVDNRFDYRETRYVSLGLVNDEIFCVVHVEREGTTRLISAWKGGRKDYDIYTSRITSGPP